LVGGYFVFFHHSKSPYQFITVTKGSITETVSVTGNTTPMQNVSLGFQNSGIISHVYYNLGDTVNAGDVIAELNTADLSAALQQAQAQLDTQKANLASLQQGTRPEQLALDESAVTDANTALLNAIQNGYIQAQDGINNKISPFFGTNSTIQEPIVLSSQYYNLLPTMLQTVSSWNSEVSSATPSDPSKLAVDVDKYLSSLISSVDSVNSDVSSQANQTNLPLSVVQPLLAQITAVRVTLTNTKTAVDNTLSTLVADQGALTLAQAGPTADNVASQQAQVEQAQAGVSSAEVNLQNSKIVAPISGVITQQDAKIGQLTSMGTSLVSIVGSSGFEVDTGVAETDIGKIVLGDKAIMTLDAFPNETFTGSVFYVAPAETNTQGVITYLVKISFDKPDSRLKSGLTANVDIQTKNDDNALILPQYAILQNDQGTFVETIENKKIVQNPVTLGIADQKGNVELLSGATEGEQVLNIGLKAQ
jgi:HlyD family secretion protein